MKPSNDFTDWRPIRFYSSADAFHLFGSKREESREIMAMAMSACEAFGRVNLSERGDDSLISKLRSGDSEALNEMARRNLEPMMACAKRILRSAEDCEDAVQNAFASAIASIGEFAGESRISTWLHRIVVNECLMRLRSQKRKTRISSEMSDTLANLQDGRSDGRTPGPLEQIEDAETRAKIRACIAQLPEPYRIVVELRDLEELDTQETADRLGVSTSVVKTRLHRARQALRRLLEPELDRAA